MLVLYNTLTKSKEPFQPLNQDKIGMYVCGPTVYDFPHLGNALSVVVYDCLYRLLRMLYGIDKVIYVRNITDVDDKINDAAKQKKISIQQLTTQVIADYTKDITALNCLPPVYEPKATEHIPEMIQMIEILIAKGHAYIADGHVFFAVKTDPKYGEIAGRKLDEMMSGVRIDVSNIKQSPEDFVLWKPAGTDYDSSAIFDSPWGKGRPGWHIECSAMASKYLGANFDIHGGGVDLLFPHHTNEIAQSCCANGNSRLANYWVHNGFLTVEGEKMSKSLGNFITLRELLSQNIQGEVIRYVFMSSHYRKPTDWNAKEMIDAKATLNNYYSLMRECQISNDNVGEIPAEFVECLTDDLNTPKAYAFMHEIAKSANIEKNFENKKKIVLQLKTCGNLLGLLEKDYESWFHGDISNEDRLEIEGMIAKRLEAKSNKDYVLADNIRNNLQAKGIIIEDKNDGTSTWKKIGV